MEKVSYIYWTPIWGRNNIFCLCVCHILKLCSIWLPRWKACQRKKSYWWSCKRFHALWILANYSHMYDWDNFIIHTTNHIWCNLFGITYFCVFAKFSTNIFTHSSLYSTRLRISSWWMWKSWHFYHETDEYHMEIHFDCVQYVSQLLSSLSRSTPGISNADKRSKLW